MCVIGDQNVAKGWNDVFYRNNLLRRYHNLSCKITLHSTIFHLILTFMLSFLGIVGGNVSGTNPCDRSRKILTDSWGIITDGPPGSNYTQDSHCEWLIKANNSRQYITLSFLSMGTECSYDYIFVHDGDSFDSPLLGSFSGRTKPQSITATSGYMLILLYSDTNYVLDGFQAEYLITDCPHNCSGHGTCVNKLKDGHFTCNCGLGDGTGHSVPYGGPDCSLLLCPDNCGLSEGHGICSLASVKAIHHGKKYKEARCICNKGYSGESCSLSRTDVIGNRWHWLSRSRGPHVAGHSAVYVGGTVESFFVFGGFDLNEVSGQLWAYRFANSHWELMDGNSEGGEGGGSKEVFNVTLPINTGYSSTSSGASPILFRELMFSVTSNSTVSIRAKVRTERTVNEKHPKNSGKHVDDLSIVGTETTKDTRKVEGMSRSSVVAEEEDNGEEEHVRPAPRYGHAACWYPGGFVMYGGKLSDGTLSDELWFYDAEVNRWSLRGMNSKFRPPPLTRHTLTLGADGWIYLFGGSTVPSKEGDGTGARMRGIGAPGEFSSSLYRIRLSTYVSSRGHCNEGSKRSDQVAKEEGDQPYQFSMENPGNLSSKERKNGEQVTSIHDVGIQRTLVNVKNAKENRSIGTESGGYASDTSELNFHKEENNGDQEKKPLDSSEHVSEEIDNWEELRPRGGKTLDVRVAAHSTVFYAPSNSLLVFGGIVAGGTARFSRLSDRLYAYHLEEAQWAELRGYPAQRPVLRDPYVPGERAFHTAAVVGNYMVVFGGYSHRHNKEEICYDNQMYFYHLGCHTWISHEILPHVDKDWNYPKGQGVFAHAMDKRGGNTLLVVGGYHGNVNSDLLAYSLPPTLAPAPGISPEQSCSNHKKILECTSDPECGWCSADETCYGRTLTANCTTNLQTTRCPGICPALGDCHSCLIHGKMNHSHRKSQSVFEESNTPISVSYKLHLGQCTWCVQNARCHHKDDNFGVCGTQEDTAAGGVTGDGPPVGWWGPQGTEVLRVQQCRTLDHRPGLTFLKYKHPANYTHPDYVGIINATTADFNLPGIHGTRTELPLGGEVRARLLGFLWPPQAASLQSSSMKMPVGPGGATIRICASYSSASLFVSRPQTNPPKMELVANLTAENRNCTLALWPQTSGEPVILEKGEVQLHTKVRNWNVLSSSPWTGRHLVDFEARKTARGSGPQSAHHHSKMELLYNYNSEDNNKVFTFEYLEPYSNGSCGSYHNCLHCLTDSSCGWCETVGKCMSRSVNETEECLYPPSIASPSSKNREWHYLTLLPSNCPNCSNFVSCETCMGAGDICEWWTEDACCARRGRSPDAVISLSQCPSPCHHRVSCSECLGEPGRCVWCDSTQECFSFSVYTSEYQFGLCREWVDQDYSSYHIDHGSITASHQPNLPPLTRHHRLGGVVTSRSKEVNRLSGRMSPTWEPKGILSTEQCRSCERHLNCSSCLRSLECGWCYSSNDPAVGVCVRGDFTKPRLGSCAVVLATLNSTFKSLWSHNISGPSKPSNVHAGTRMVPFHNKVKRQSPDLKANINNNGDAHALENSSPPSVTIDMLPSSSSTEVSLGTEDYLTTSGIISSTATTVGSASLFTESEDKGKKTSTLSGQETLDSTTESVQSVVDPVLFRNEEDNSSNMKNSTVNVGENPVEDVKEVWLWAYSECPDVDECALGRHQCNSKAECHNTHGSYICQCKRGYIGDGVTHCNKTCYEECRNGYCVGEPEFRCQCVLGWTGPDCATDCGCHNHSTCDGSTRLHSGSELSKPIGPGHCDLCQEMTQGEFCEECRSGSYEDPKAGHLCHHCRCNGHGDKDKGLCDRRTGSCFCTGHTQGESCESCEKGYFGDPRKGGTCYSGCGPRVVLMNEMSGGIGSELGIELTGSSQLLFSHQHFAAFNSTPKPIDQVYPPQDCLWIIDPHGSLVKSNGSKSEFLEPVIIQLYLAKGSVTGIECGEGSVHVYDGLPAFVASLPSSSTSSSIPLSSSSLHGHSLGAFCDHHSTYPLTLEAKSGIMTVFYQKRGSIHRGEDFERFAKAVEFFNATFKVLACPDNCPVGRVCHKSPSGSWGYCLCPDGFTGPNCERKLCESGVCPLTSGLQMDKMSNKYYSQQTTLFDSGRLPDSLDHLRRILPRFGHSLVADRRNALWIFGGYSLSNGLLNDIRMFDTRNNTWMQVTVDSTGKTSMPQGRYFHAAAAFHSGREVYIYGGLASEGRALDDLWKFSVKNHRWTKIETNHGPPPVAGHSLTLRWGDGRISGKMGCSSSLRKAMAGSDVEREEEEHKEEDVLAEEGLRTRSEDRRREDSLVLIGGFSPNEGFLHFCWEFHLKCGLWRPLNTTGSPPTGLYGHSTVYHFPTESFYVYGGYSYGTGGLSVSDRLYSLHYPSGFWSILPPFEEYNPPGLFVPGARFLHSAVTTNEYMLVLGGLTHPQNTSGGIAAYIYSCNLWIDLGIKDPESNRESLGWTLGQTAVVLNSASPFVSRVTGESERVHVYLVGGFEEGGTRAKVMLMTLPMDLCSLWQDGGKDRCRGTLGCSYCGVIRNPDTGEGPPRANVSICYSSSRSLPNECKGGGTITTNNGAMCDREWFERRNCEQYTTCAECLARWPSHPGGKQVCQWCSNCPRGRCVRRGQDCNERPASNRAPGGITTARGRGVMSGGCSVRQTAVVDVLFCPGLGCPASDCVHCSKMRGCLWTRQVLVTYELGLKVSAEPVYEWSCVRDDVSERSSIRLISSSPPAPCPPRCSSYQTCTECLSASGGGEGGWRECRWSTLLGECISPSYQPLYCVGGVCGLVLHGSPFQCPSPCSHFKQCATCLKDPRCGWCSLNTLDGKTGEGICTEGSLQSPSAQPVSSISVCHELYVRAKDNVTFDQINLEESNHSESIDQGSTFSWHYLSCPPEDECKNGHHSCHPDSQECVDLAKGFTCVCGKGYKEDDRVGCVPICVPSCIHGWCAKPNLCQCDFGYVGQDCSIKCQCNEHSNCLGPDKLDHCIECHNNTMGGQCERCLPKFVGDPTNGGQCVPCLDYCNGHTPHCINASDGSSSSYQYSGSFLELDDISFPKWSNSFLNTNGEGMSRTVAVCIGCANGTAGEKCEGCLPGYFRGSTDHRQPCRLCECHGHGDICDPVTGENCNCQNNTESDPQCLSGATNVLATVGNSPLPLSGQTLGGIFIPSGHISSKASHHGSSNTVIHQGKSGILLGNQPLQSQQTQCWKLQCSKCREYYVGSPTHGHQCYRQMVVDSEYCFDPKTQEDCSGKPNPLLPGRTAFLVVQPRFMNVDIRMTVDVTQGGLDLFLAPREDAFTILTNDSTGDHMVELDPRFRIKHDDPYDEDLNTSKEDFDKTGKEESPAVSSNDPRVSSRGYPQRGNSVAGPISFLPRFRVIERQASGLATYITLDDPFSILVVRNLRNRLVLTLPQAAHDLGSTRFHISLLGLGVEKGGGDYEESADERDFDGIGERLWKSGSGAGGGWEHAARSKRSMNLRNSPSHATTFGIAFFRQDQLHIDLFVFFSVFFSCFFLLLASGVVVWRAKRAADARRARRQHVVQMLHLAQRPFASVSLLLDSPGNEEEIYQCSPCHSSGEESEEVDCGGETGQQGMRCRKHGPRKWGVAPEHLSHPGQVGNSTRPSSPARTALSTVNSGEGSIGPTGDTPSRKKPQRCVGGQWGMMGDKWRPGQGNVHRGVRPIAVEPTEDGVAGIASVIVKLPGGREAPVQLALASALILLSRVYPVNGRAFLRRRSSGHHHHHHHHQGAV